MSQNVDTASLSARRCLVSDCLSSINAETTSCLKYFVYWSLEGEQDANINQLLPEGGGACSIFTDQQVSLI